MIADGSAGPNLAGFGPEENIMACWVAPTVAAEYWNVPVEHVLERIASGEIASKALGGFTLIDVDPETRTPDAASTLSRSEIEAMDGAFADNVAQTALRESGDYREARRLSGAKRRPPARQAVA